MEQHAFHFEIILLTIHIIDYSSSETLSLNFLFSVKNFSYIGKYVEKYIYIYIYLPSVSIEVS